MMIRFHEQQELAAQTCFNQLMDNQDGNVWYSTLAIIDIHCIARLLKALDIYLANSQTIYRAIQSDNCVMSPSLVRLIYHMEIAANDAQ